MSKGVKNIVVIICVLVVLILIAVLWPSNKAVVDTQTGVDVNDDLAEVSDENTDDSMDSEASVTARGIVTSVDSSMIAVDGPYVVTIETEEGEQLAINVPSMGISVCSAQAAIANTSDVDVGDTVEVSGSASGDGAIVPCDSDSDYFRVVTE